MSKVVNPSAGNLYFTNGGSAISSITQPDIDGGSFAGSASDGAELNGVLSIASRSTLDMSGEGTYIRTNMSVLSDAANRRAINQVESVYTYHVAQAINSGLWSEYSGVFSTTPSNTEDFSVLFPNGGVDDAANTDYNTRGEFAYNYSTTAVSGDY